MFSRYFPNAFQLNQHNKYFLMDASYERAGTLGFRCVADAVQPADGRPNFWVHGSGTYCNRQNGSANGQLCGRIETGSGYNDLTALGGLDWLALGCDDKDDSDFKMVRKALADGGDAYIANLSATSYVSTYSGNSRGYYWSDGGSDVPVLSRDDASSYGVYVGKGEMSFSVGRLRGGYRYKVRVFVGVYKERGSVEATLMVNGKSGAPFAESSVYDADDTANV